MRKLLFLFLFCCRCEIKISWFAVIFSIIMRALSLMLDFVAAETMETKQSVVWGRKKNKFSGLSGVNHKCKTEKKML